MKKIKLGLISAGGIIRWAHVPALKGSESFEMTAICDPNKEAADSLAKELGITNVFYDYNDLLNCKDVEAVDIGTPNYWHSIIAIAALEKGLHVITEKPDAINPEEAEKMKIAADKSGKVLMPIRNNRFNVANAFLKGYIDEGHFGSIYSAKCGWIRRNSIPGKGGWFTNKALSGGGPLIDLGVHMIDLTMWLMGNPTPVSVSGATYQKFGQLTDEEIARNLVYDIEDLATGFIRFDNGATLQIEFSWASHIARETKYFDLLGERGGAKWADGNLLGIFSTSKDGTILDTIPKFGKGARGEHAQNLEHFANVINGAEVATITPEQGVNMIKILCGIYKSAEEGREIRL